MKASRATFDVPKKGKASEITDIERQRVVEWCNCVLSLGKYRMSLSDPFGNPAFVATVGAVWCNMKVTQAGYATTKPRVTVQQLALVSLKVRYVFSCFEVFRILTLHVWTRHDASTLVLSH